MAEWLKDIHDNLVVQFQSDYQLKIHLNIMAE